MWCLSSKVFEWYTPTGGERFSLVIGSLSNNAFERRTSTGSELFFPFNLPWGHQICIAKCLTLKETICPRICSKSLPTSAKSPISVNVPNISWRYQICFAKCLYSLRHVLPGICSKSRVKSSKSPLLVDVCRSKTWLPKLPIFAPQNSCILQFDTPIQSIAFSRCN